jgi:hypothetical protein
MTDQEPGEPAAEQLVPGRRPWRDPTIEVTRAVDAESSPAPESTADGSTAIS